MRPADWLLQLLPVERMTHLSGGDPDVLAIPLLLGSAFMFLGVLNLVGAAGNGTAARRAARRPAGALWFTLGLALVVASAAYLGAWASH